MGGHEVGDTGDYFYSTLDYPTPDRMTHPSTTILLQDLSGILAEGLPNVWSVFVGRPTDPHSGKSNYLFCDGRVEMLTPAETTAEMWQSQWTPAEAAGEEVSK